MKKFLVSTADVYGYDTSDNLLFVGKTLLDSSIEVTLGNTDVRAGKGNQLQYVYYHTAEMNISIKEAQFSLDYIALLAGANKITGKNIFMEETITVTSGAGSVTETPLALSGTTVYGWASLSDGTVERVTFTSNAFQLTDPTLNGDICVRYYANNVAATSVTIYADMLPSTIRLVMEATLASSEATTNKIGIVQIEVPKASMTGAFALSMTPDSVANTPLAMRALSSNSGATGCASGQSIYATITEILNDANWYDGVIALAIEGGDFSLAVADTKQLRVFAIPSVGAAFLAPVADITFSTSDAAKATVSSGLVTGVATGPSTIKATITSKTAIDANVIVTVTA